MISMLSYTHQSFALTHVSFFEEVRRIAAPDYIPNEADVLRARTKTTGIYETRFTMGQLSIQLVTDGMPTQSGSLTSGQYVRRGRPTE